MKHSRAAARYFEEMQALGIQPNIIIYTTLIGVYSVTGEVESAMDVFEKVERTLLKDTDELHQKMIYSSIMSAYSRAGDYARTRELFTKMVASGIVPTHPHFNALMSSCARNAHADIAQ